MALVCLFTLAAPTRAAADSTTVFAVTGSFPGGYSFSAGSTVTIDTTTGLATGAALTIDPLSLVFNGVPGSQNFPNEYEWLGLGGTALSFSFEASSSTSFLGFTGGAVQSVELTLASGQITSADLQLTPITATPEPGSIFLIGTGLVGLMGKTLRRKRLA